MIENWTGDKMDEMRFEKCREDESIVGVKKQDEVRRDKVRVKYVEVKWNGGDWIRLD